MRWGRANRRSCWLWRRGNSTPSWKSKCSQLQSQQLGFFLIRCENNFLSNMLKIIFWNQCWHPSRYLLLFFRLKHFRNQFTFFVLYERHSFIWITKVYFICSSFENLSKNVRQLEYDEVIPDLKGLPYRKSRVDLDTLYSIWTIWRSRSHQGPQRKKAASSVNSPPSAGREFLSSGFSTSQSYDLIFSNFPFQIQF